MAKLSSGPAARIWANGSLWSSSAPDNGVVAPAMSPPASNKIREIWIVVVVGCSFFNVLDVLDKRRPPEAEKPGFDDNI